MQKPQWMQLRVKWNLYTIAFLQTYFFFPNKISLLSTGDTVPSLWWPCSPGNFLISEKPGTSIHWSHMWMIVWEVFQNVNKRWGFIRSLSCAILYLPKKKLYPHHKNHQCTLYTHKKKSHDILVYHGQTPPLSYGSTVEPQIKINPERFFLITSKRIRNLNSSEEN